MLKSTFLSMGLHTFLILAAYFGLPSFKTNEIIEQPIDIVEDTPISSKTSLKLGIKTVKKVKKNIEIHILIKNFITINLWTNEKNVYKKTPTSFLKVHCKFITKFIADLIVQIKKNPQLRGFL